MFVLAIILAVLGLTSPFIVKGIFGGSTLSYDMLSNLGDWLGGTSAPLLNLAAFIMILAAYNSQQEELELTREEMKLTRKEFEEQNLTMSLQRFENTFFNLLSVNKEIVNALQFDCENKELKTPVTVTGRKYFKVAYDELHEIYKQNQTRKNSGTSATVVGLLGEFDDSVKKRNEVFLIAVSHEYGLISYSYDKFFEYHQFYLGHYFRNLYHTIRIIDKAPISENDKKDFVKIVVAQLSTHELFLLFYNCFVSYGKEHFKHFILKYGMLDNIDRSGLLHKDHWKLFCDESKK